MATPSLEQIAIDLALDAGLTPAYQTALRWFASQPGFSFEHPVEVQESQHIRKTMSLRDAFWLGARGELDHHRTYKLKEHFYTPKSAQELLDLDPHFFTKLPRGQHLFEMIIELNQKDDEFRDVFETRYIQGALRRDNGDAWLGVVLSQLKQEDHRRPDTALTWAALLRLDSQQGCRAFLEKNPNAWSLKKDGEKISVFQSMNSRLSYAIWELFQEKADLYRQDASHKLPLWRRVLPQNPTSTAQSGTFRAGVEEWLGEEFAKRPTDSLMSDYLVSMAFFKVFPFNSAQSQPNFHNAKEVLEKAPVGWVEATPKGYSLPAYQALLLRTTGGKNNQLIEGPQWAAALKANKKWWKALGPQGQVFVHLALAVKAKSMEKMPDSVTIDELEQPEVQEFIGKLTTLHAVPKLWETHIKPYMTMKKLEQNFEQFPTVSSNRFRL